MKSKSEGGKYGAREHSYDSFGNSVEIDRIDGILRSSSSSRVIFHVWDYHSGYLDVSYPGSQSPCSTVGSCMPPPGHFDLVSWSLDQRTLTHM